MFSWYVSETRSRAVMIDAEGRVFSVVETASGGFNVLHETVQHGYWCGTRDTLFEAQILAQCVSAGMVLA